MIKFGNFIVTDNSGWLSESSSPGPTPPTPVLPAGTVRVRTSDGNAPVKSEYTSYETATLVAGTSDVYDVYKSGTSFEALLRDSTNVTEVLDANTTGITNMKLMFADCYYLTSVSLFDTSSVTTMGGMFTSCYRLVNVPLFDTSNVTDMGMFSYCRNLTTVPLFNTSSATRMNGMFLGCTSLTSIPLFNTSSVIDMSSMFENCYAVESGALALYQQASTQATPPVYYSDCFKRCGKNTTTGAAELAQIPASWGGTGA